MTVDGATATLQLVTAGRQIRGERLPPEVRALAMHATLDWVGVTLAGVREPAARLVYEVACQPDHGREASLVGFGRRASLRSAALLHGTAAHALDYDDTHWGLQGHPTAPVLGALWGLAEREGASGLQLLAACVAGVEVECRLGRWLNPEHYARGFHATGTLGAFGAAAAAAHLLDLDERTWVAAFGLAGTMAAGLKSAFGSMAKPLHAGRAAEAGLLAALLAARGFRGSDHILEDPQGFAATHAPAPLAAAPPPTGAGFEIESTLFKYHAACHLTHATIEALHELRRDQPLAVDDVTAIELHVDATCLGVCAIDRPATGMEAKFSLKAIAAMTLLGDATEDPRAFQDARLRDPALERLMARVRVQVAAMPATRTEVHVLLRDGRRLRADHDSGVPESDRARQAERLVRKFDRLAPLPERARARVRELVLTLDERAELRELYALVSGIDGGTPPIPAR